MTVLSAPDIGSSLLETAENANGSQPVWRGDAVIPAGPASPIDLSELAARIERHGINTIGQAILDRLARRGVARGLRPEVAAIVGDNNAPEVARERAFGLLHRRLAEAPGTAT